MQSSQDKAQNTKENTKCVLQSNSISHLCKDCYRTFKDINNYKEHRFQEHHITEFPNIRKCSMCSYATLLKSKYDCHMRCHLNNKVIKCNRCDYSTINIRHMSRHERMHMLSSSVKTENLNNSNQEFTKTKYIRKLKNDLIKNSKLKLNNTRRQFLQNGSLLKEESNNDQHNVEACSNTQKPMNISLELIKNLLNQYDKTKTDFSIDTQYCANLSSHSSNLVTPPSIASSVSSLASSPSSIHNLSNSTTPPLQLPLHYSLAHQFNNHTQDHYPTISFPCPQQHQAQNYYLSSPFNQTEIHKKNIENYLKLQNTCSSASSLNPNMYSQSQLFCSLLSPPAVRSQNNDNLETNRDIRAGFGKFECENLGHCRHKFELEYLRGNVFKILTFLMPQIISMFNLDMNSIESTSQIDKLIDYLINNNNGNINVRN